MTTRPRFIGFRKTIDGEADAQRLFAALTDHGAKPGAVLLQSSDNIPKYGERSLAAVHAALRIEARHDDFSITALDAAGRLLLPTIHRRLPESARIETQSANTIRGTLAPDLRTVSGRQRPFRTNHMDVLRAVAFSTGADEQAPLPTHALFGCFAYEFIHQYESFERNPRDLLNEPDVLFFLATRMFMIDHAAKTTHLVASAPVVPGTDLADVVLSAEAHLADMIRIAQDPPPLRTMQTTCSPFKSDTDQATYRKNVERIKDHIREGRVYQAVYGRTLTADFEGQPFDAYTRLSKINPSPYMFYLRDDHGALLAASPEMAVRVTNHDHHRRVEVRPIAGTKPRGFIPPQNQAIDPLTDAKYETALKIDPKELAEHVMLVDLARNDIASVAQPGTTVVDEPFVVEKYSHVQHLVSNVSGHLRDDLDALHAYLATMNMGTVTGAPKLEAMKLINELETSSRGFFAGSVGYVTPDGQMDTALTIRAIRIKSDRAHVRVAAGIVADSHPESEWIETQNKAAACLRCMNQTEDPN